MFHVVGSCDSGILPRGWIRIDSAPPVGFVAERFAVRAVVVALLGAELYIGSHYTLKLNIGKSSQSFYWTAVLGAVARVQQKIQCCGRHC